MEDFIQLVRDPQARDLLEREIEGRGAFRRFKDTLFEFPELRDEWFALRDVRARRRAVEWLRDEDLVDDRLEAGAGVDGLIGLGHRVGWGGVEAARIADASRPASAVAYG